MDTFGQLLEMDDDEDHSFSKALTWDYFEQASRLLASDIFLSALTELALTGRCDFQRDGCGRVRPYVPGPSIASEAHESL